MRNPWGFTSWFVLYSWWQRSDGESYPVFSGKRWIKQGVLDLCVHFMIGNQNWMHSLHFFMLKLCKVDGKKRWCRDWIEMVSLIYTLFYVSLRESSGLPPWEKWCAKVLRKIAFSFHGLPLRYNSDWIILSKKRYYYGLLLHV